MQQGFYLMYFYVNLEIEVPVLIQVFKIITYSTYIIAITDQYLHQYDC